MTRGVSMVWGFRVRRRLGLGLAVGLLTLLTAATQLAMAGPLSGAATSPCAFLPPSNNLLQSVAATSASNAWTVGEYDTGSATKTLIMHWNGSSWKQVSSPNPSSFDSQLFGVAAISAKDAWAVGVFCNGHTYHTLIVHWNGSSWKQVPSPSPAGSSGHNLLEKVAATSASNAWAVGLYGATGSESNTKTMILHWNGKAWKQVSSPNPSHNDDELYGVSATSAKDTWAVGYSVPPPPPGRLSSSLHTLLLHWNGTKWTRVASPNVKGSDFNEPLSVAASSSTNAWSVGNFNNSSSETQTLSLRWNGTAWKVVPSPNPGGSSAESAFNSVVTLSPANAWGVGYYFDTATSTTETMALHWNGTAWHKAPTPSPGSSVSSLLAVAGASSTNIWAVGDSSSTSASCSEGTFVDRTLVVHWNGTAWKQASSPSPGVACS
jgi:hypothetical protein